MELIIIVFALLIYIVAANIGELSNALWSLLEYLVKMIFNTEETDFEINAKKVLKRCFIVLLNISFIFIVGVFLWWLGDMFYQANKQSISSYFIVLAPGFLQKAGLIVLIGIVALSVFIGLLWAFKFIHVLDIFKFYLFFEIIVMLVNYSNAASEHKSLYLIQLLNKVFGKELIDEPKKDTVTKGSTITNYSFNDTLPNIGIVSGLIYDSTKIRSGNKKIIWTVDTSMVKKIKFKTPLE